MAIALYYWAGGVLWERNILAVKGPIRLRSQDRGDARAMVPSSAVHRSWSRGHIPTA